MTPQPKITVSHMMKKNPFYTAEADPEHRDARSSIDALWQNLEAMSQGIELHWPTIGIAVINLLAWLIFTHDKRQAIIGGWRIPERTLLVLALIGGSPAILLGRRVVRHKTRKQPFSTLLIGIVGLQALAFLALLYTGLTTP